MLSLSHLPKYTEIHFIVHLLQNFDGDWPGRVRYPLV